MGKNHRKQEGTGKTKQQHPAITTSRKKVKTANPNQETKENPKKQCRGMMSPKEQGFQAGVED